jgi:uncharacterized membrane protein
VSSASVLDVPTLLAITAMSAATLATRLGGYLLLGRVNLRGRAKAAFDALPPAILMAVIAPTIFLTGPAETLAAAFTAVAALLRLPLLAVILTGVASVVVLRLLLT